MTASVSTLFAPATKAAPKQAYAAKVESLDDDAFLAECRRVAVLAEFALGDPSSDFHWQDKVCAGQAALRGRSDIYEMARVDGGEGRASVTPAPSADRSSIR